MELKRWLKRSEDCLGSNCSLLLDSVLLQDPTVPTLAGSRFNYRFLGNVRQKEKTGKILTGEELMS